MFARIYLILGSSWLDHKNIIYLDFSDLDGDRLQPCRDHSNTLSFLASGCLPVAKPMRNKIPSKNGSGGVCSNTPYLIICCQALVPQKVTIFWREGWFSTIRFRDTTTVSDSCFWRIRIRRCSLRHQLPKLTRGTVGLRTRCTGLLDVNMNTGCLRNRTGPGVENRAVLRRLALNLARMSEGKKVTLIRRRLKRRVGITTMH